MLLLDHQTNSQKPLKLINQLINPLINPLINQLINQLINLLINPAHYSFKPILLHINLIIFYLLPSLVLEME